MLYFMLYTSASHQLAAFGPHADQIMLTCDPKMTIFDATTVIANALNRKRRRRRWGGGRSKRSRSYVHSKAEIPSSRGKLGKLDFRTGGA
jgi:hypothetical protein